MLRNARVVVVAISSISFMLFSPCGNRPDGLPDVDWWRGAWAFQFVNARFCEWFMVRAVATAQYILKFWARSSDQVDARFGTGPLDLVEYAIREVRHDNVWLMLFFFCHVNVTEGQNVKQVLWNGVDRVCSRMRLAFVFVWSNFLRHVLEVRT